MWPEPDEDDEEGLKLVRDLETIAKAEHDPVFREFVSLYLQTSDEGREKIKTGMLRLASLPKDVQDILSYEQRESVIKGESNFLVH